MKFSTYARPKHTHVLSCNEGHRDVTEFPVGFCVGNLGALQSNCLKAYIVSFFLVQIPF